MAKEYPKVGTAVWVRKNGKVLMGLRKGFGAGTWCAPGGHIEMYETSEDCAVRETMEEASVSITNLKFVTACEKILPEAGRHFITLFYVADWVSGEPVPQPEEFEQWRWYAWDELPSPLLPMAESFIHTGINPLDL